VFGAVAEDSIEVDLSTLQIANIKNLITKVIRKQRFGVSSLAFTNRASK
jgi:hypothetical protein